MVKRNLRVLAVARKRTGEIGITKITAGPQGRTAEVIHTPLPDNKEDLEDYFARRFVEKFNSELPLGPGVRIEGVVQNDTSDLDFSIESPIANYLEVAELNPRSQKFGRQAYETGVLDVYEYSKWVTSDIVIAKANRYGADVSRSTILLLYVTHWQFFPSDALIKCLTSSVLQNGVQFAAIFILQGSGGELNILYQILPYEGSSLPSPRQFRGSKCQNFEPGKSEWNSNL